MDTQELSIALNNRGIAAIPNPFVRWAKIIPSPQLYKFLFPSILSHNYLIIPDYILLLIYQRS